MTSRTFLLWLHITGVTAWLGANLVQLVVTPRLSREGREASAAWVRQQIFLGERYYSAVGAWIGITGVLLVLDLDLSWSSGFIWVGIAVIALGAGLGVAVFAPVTKRRLAAIEAGDEAESARLQGRTVRFALLDSALVLLAILAMVDAWRIR